ncbi:LLM class flavin-dependent oxidoreductase [Amycolatopsis sp. NPDC026612]|uniref:LLM class flavin-dependent oxidoreductase n=1 Tax=Amycolatopsis sp. NPDC026612 TaxID=3155466 RepID=UPI0033FF7339
MMKIGVALNMTAQPGVPDARCLREHLELAVLAESLGFDSAFVTEHHFSDYALTPSPLQLLTYLAARTDRLLLGTAVVVIPWHNPVRLVEEILTLDALSNGRLIIGVGRGTAGREYEGLGCASDESENRFTDGLHTLVSALTTSASISTGSSGKTFIPRPRSENRRTIPFYTASTSGRCGATAASLGLRQLVAGQADFHYLRTHTTGYHASVIRAGHTPKPPMVLVLATSRPNDTQSEDVARPYLNNDWDLVESHYQYTNGTISTVRGYESHKTIEDHFRRIFSDRSYREIETDKLISTQLIGAPEKCVANFVKLVQYTETDHVLLEFCYGGMPLTTVRESMEYFASEVLPQLRTVSEAGGRTPGE